MDNLAELSFEGGDMLGMLLYDALMAAWVTIAVGFTDGLIRVAADRYNQDRV
jgi:hypothetical protein